MPSSTTFGYISFSDTCTMSAECDDGSLCTTGTCSGGACIHTPVCPDDGDACTLNSCDPATGACSNPPDSCNDGDACTADSCDMVTGCSNTPLDCAAPQTCVGGECVLPLCNDDGVCQAGEDCLSCPNDCAGKQNGSPANQFCCGDLTCQSAEDSFTCAVDCGAPSVCGDGNCDFGEDPCSCPGDCGLAPSNEVPNATCSDGVDNDCGGGIDCQDSDCSGIDPACQACMLGQVGDTCSNNGECCSGKCRGPKNNKTCR